MSKTLRISSINAAGKAAAPRPRAGLSAPRRLGERVPATDMRNACLRLSRSCAAAILLEADDEALTTRLVERGKTSNRTDDSPEAIERRLRTFKLQASSMMEKLRERGAMTTINAAMPADAVFAAVCDVYDGVVK